MKKHAYFLSVLFFTIISTLSGQNIKIKLNSPETNINIISKSQTNFRAVNTISTINVEQKSNQTGNFYKLDIDNYNSNPYNTGKADLPVLNKLIEIPHEAEASIKIISYDIEYIDLSEYGITNYIYPVQPSYSKSEDPANIIFRFDNTYYQTDAFTNEPLAKIEEIGLLRETRIGRLTISPVQYNPVKNILKIYNNIVLEVVFDNANITLTNSQKAKTYSPFFEGFNKSLINHVPNAAKDLITQYPVKFVIVADPVYQTILQPYVQWKTRKGFNVIEAYTDDPLVGSTTASIKAYLQGLYNAGTPTDPAPSFVLFVGDVAQIPTWNGTTASHKTDLYYCEYSGDYLPDVYYGRWSANTISELQPQIDKTLMYEQYTMPDPSYLGYNLLIAGVDQEGGDPNGYSSVHGNGQLQYGMTNYMNAAHGISVYEYLYPLSDDPASVANIKADFNLGTGFANYTAHCSSVGWSNPSFTTPDVANMTNIYKFGLMVGNCCQSATFNDAECFGEAVLRKVDAGAVGYIGGSNYSYWDEDYHWGVGASNIQSSPPVAYSASELGAYDRNFHDNGEPEADWFVTNYQMIMAGNLAVEQAGDAMKDYYWEIYNLLGDPSVMNYFGVPSQLSATYTNPVPVGTNTLTVSTEQYAYVAISQNNILLDAQYTGANTSVTLTFPAFLTPGTADIVVTKQNRAPYIGTLDIIDIASNNDAMVVSIDTPVVSYDCVQDIQPVVTIRNMGTTNLTSCDVSYYIDGGTPVTISWTGNLPQLSTDVVVFPTITLTTGNHTITAFTQNPNGTSDDYTPNDTLNKIFDVNNLTITASFTADEVLFCDTPATVTFTNTSTNAQTYFWDFGDGNTSSAFDTTYTYTAQGDYTVTLIATNGVCGSDTLQQINLVSINPANPCEYIMPNSGTVTETACSGTLFDSGGQAGNYGNNEDAVFIISPPGVASVSVTFNLFDIEAEASCSYDYLELHDGVGTGAASLGRFCNGSLPSGTITSTTGSISVHFHSDVSVVQAGFEMDWVCNMPTSPPVADFVSDTVTTCSGIVEFTDLSTNGPTSWLWDFGDGNTSTNQNPVHTYTGNGTYTVSLTVNNSFGSDTFSVPGVVVVNMPVAPVATNDTSCGAASLTLTANGTGLVNWYDSIAGGNLINSGTTYITPLLTATTTYYVEDVILAPVYNVGSTDNSANGSFFTSNRYLIFDALVDLTIVSVEVNANGQGNRTVELRDNSGAVVASSTINVPDGISRINLNFDVPAGTNYELAINGTTNLWRNNAAVNFPYTVPGVISITNSDAGSAYYYFFYDWEVKVGDDCISARTPVSAIIESEQVVEVSVNTASTTVCQGDTATFTAIAVNGGNNPVYHWNLNGVVVDSGSTYLATGLNQGDMISCTLTSSATCITGNPANSDTLTINVENSPVSGFYYATNFLDVTFTDNSVNATSYYWDFGDGNTSTDQNPVHTYGSDGTYTVTLVSSNICGSDTSSITIGVIGLTVGKLPDWTDIEIYPNPTSGILILDFNNNKIEKIELYDVLGKKQLSKTNNCNTTELYLENFNKGVYFLKLIAGNDFSVFRIILN